MWLLICIIFPGGSGIEFILFNTEFGDYLHLMKYLTGELLIKSFNIVLPYVRFTFLNWYDASV